jgi:hypothetical protein
MGKRTLWESEFEVVWRHALNDMITNTDSLLEVDMNTLDVKRYLIFMTYQLDVALFETEVLCNLPGINDCGTLRETARFYKLEEYLENVSVTVLHDSNNLINSSRRSSINVLPVEIKGGVFHPKVVLYGLTYNNRSELGIMVGSANLTCHGIGNNRESLFSLEGKLPGSLCKDIAGFLKSLKKTYLSCYTETSVLSGIDFIISECDNREKAKYPFRGGVNLLATGPEISESNDSLEHAASRFRLCEDLMCWAPYFPAEWPDKNAILPMPVVEILKNTRLNGESVWFCPAPKADGRYCLSPEFRSYCKSSETIAFMVEDIAISSKGRFRFTHAKLYRIECNGSVFLFIGSHNMTAAAWGGENITSEKPVSPLNIEVSICVECSGEFECYNTKIGEEAFKPLAKTYENTGDNEDDIQGDICPPTPPMIVMFDWQIRKYSVTLFEVSKYANCTLVLPFIGTVTIDPQKKVNDFSVASNQLTFSDMSYTVHTRRTDGFNEYFKGIVLESNGAFRTLAFESLKEYMDSLEGKIETDPPGGKKGPDNNRKPDKLPKRVLFNPDDTWYDFFRQAENLCNKLKSDAERGHQKHIFEFVRLYEIEIDKLETLEWLDKAKLWLLFKQVEVSVGMMYALIRIKRKVMIFGEELKLDRTFELWVDACLLVAENSMGLNEVKDA